jgi:hypothetical protein
MLTDRQIKSLKTDRPQVDVFDGEIPGFGVRLTNRGRKSFFLFYRARRLADPRRRLHRVTLGAYPYLSLAEARERARSPGLPHAIDAADSRGAARCRSTGNDWRDPRASYATGPRRPDSRF